MGATAIYIALLNDIEIRKQIHTKHLATFEAFYEGLRVVKKDLGFIKGK
jgi:hypothetical protein